MEWLWEGIFQTKSWPSEKLLFEGEPGLWKRTVTGGNLEPWKRSPKVASDFFLLWFQRQKSGWKFASISEKVFTTFPKIGHLGAEPTPDITWTPLAVACVGDPVQAKADPPLVFSPDRIHPASSVLYAPAPLDRPTGVLCPPLRHDCKGSFHPLWYLVPQFPPNDQPHLATSVVTESLAPEVLFAFTFQGRGCPRSRS